MLREQQEKVIRTVKIGDDEYHTLDDYSNEPQLDTADDEVEKEDIWGDEENLQFSNVPEELWSDSPVDVVPGQPEPWVDTCLRMRLKFSVYLAWEFCKRVVISKVKSAAL